MVLNVTSVLSSANEWNSTPKREPQSRPTPKTVSTELQSIDEKSQRGITRSAIQEKMRRGRSEMSSVGGEISSARITNEERITREDATTSGRDSASEGLTQANASRTDWFRKIFPLLSRQIITDRIGEICSCRRLTTQQIDQLKQILASSGSSSAPSIEIIANKSDFHQQTIQLRDILVTHNNALLARMEEIVTKKRKRDSIEDEQSDDSYNPHQ